MKNDKIVKNVKKKINPKPVIKEVVNEDGTVTKQEHVPTVPDDDGFESINHSETHPSEDEENRNNTQKTE